MLHQLRLVIVLGGLFALGCAVEAPATAPTTLAAPSTAPATQPAALRWQKDLDAFLREDQLSDRKPGGIVFVGSSSIRLWNTLKEDFPGQDCLNRGFGGSWMIDVVRLADALVIKHRPDTVLVYAGDNDLTGKTTPEELAAQFMVFCQLVHRELPQTRIIFIAIKPSPSRVKILEKQTRANALIREQTAADPRLAFADIVPPMLDATGQPRPELFRQDMLHMNRAGYEIWTQVIRPMLEGDQGTTERKSQ